ncbi:MAG: LysE family translocator [Gammaproteobacteria bacterium]|nr:LysE family translocator [Gammaproteobacteria bacterium]
MSIIESFTFAGIMVALAAVPSTSVALVVTRSATLGVANGVAVATGIVLGDLVFIMLAIFGLSMVAETMGSMFIVIKILGGAYLLWLGFSLLTSNSSSTVRSKHPNSKSSLIASFMAGFLLTLGDIKAIVFYASLMPVFMDLSVLKASEILVVIFVTIFCVGGVKVIYVLLANKVTAYALSRKIENKARKVAGGFIVGAGSYLIIKA